MLYETNPYKRYQQAQVETANPLDLIIMMYDGTLKFLNQAKMAIEEKKIEPAHNAIQRAHRIIDELNFSLNMEAGGEVAENLRRFYQYIDTELTKANLKKDPKIIDRIMGHLSEMKSSWVELRNAQKPNQQAVAGK
ncbi:MAG TPA: flagellar export chaperone FliS [Firmicutes bacterium]|nr:flagellar export chaperone FliS [Bacillota bacterium]